MVASVSRAIAGICWSAEFLDLYGKMFEDAVGIQRRCDYYIQQAGVLSRPCSAFSGSLLLAAFVEMMTCDMPPQ